MKALLDRLAPSDVEMEIYTREARWALFGETPPDKGE